MILAMRSMKAGGAPEREAARDQKGKSREAENGGGAPVQGDLRDAGHGGKDYENRARGGNKQPVPDCARRLPFIGGLAALHARFNVIGGDAIALPFAKRGLLPARLLRASGGGEG